MRHILLPPGPVLDGLGGEKRLENRKQTSKSEHRLVKGCRTCVAREPLVTLLGCNNSRYIYYCSEIARDPIGNSITSTPSESTVVKWLTRTDPVGAKRTTVW
ncbi:hypothetical protein K438DRAFT_1795406 [Mycena galopus ATCC 62051]|nr:hypothetical protein K438DRAFT_1795406 [Mycena galopus ATCC 62051]